jgi:transcriptional regulator with XRE-family HTH domain
VSEDGGHVARPRRLRLATELRRLRDLAGISGRALAQEIQISQSKVSRIESGATIPSLPEVERWAEAVNASPETQERLVDLTQAAVYEVHTWRTALRKRPHLQDTFQENEASVRRVRNFQCMVVPGLLQTAAYARAVFSLFELSYEKGDLANATASRVQRQVALYEEDRRFDFLIGETALRWRPGPPRLLLAQLDRIASVSTLDNVSIGVIPQGRQANAVPLHGFVIYGGDDQDDEDAVDTYVQVETAHALLTIADYDVALYEKQWSLLREMAVFDGEARDLLARIAAEIREEGRREA